MSSAHGLCMARRKGPGGFTGVEPLVVIAVVGLLAALLLCSPAVAFLVPTPGCWTGQRVRPDRGRPRHAQISGQATAPRPLKSFCRNQATCFAILRRCWLVRQRLLLTGPKRGI
jgi:hypothetical protein